jgi:CheY-like chemotaxis protein
MKRILITETKATQKEALRSAFAKLAIPFEVEFVDSADACLEFLHANERFDLCFVLIDPSVEGVVDDDLLGQLSASETLRTIPVIVFSEQVEAQLVVSCYNKGANAFVRKPAQLDDYPAVVASITNFWGSINVLAKPEPVAEFL